jgi:phage terminase large subunit
VRENKNNRENQREERKPELKIQSLGLMKKLMPCSPMMKKRWLSIVFNSKRREAAYKYNVNK